MSGKFKLTFQLTAHKKSLEMRVCGPGGETKGETALPPGDTFDKLRRHDPSKPPSDLIGKAGQTLYQTLVNEAVDELVIDTLNDGISAGEPVQFELRLDPDQTALATYPWEMIQNPQGQFLVRDGMVDLTRYITYPQPPSTFDPAIKDLPLFRVISQPDRLPPIIAVDLMVKPLETLPNATFDGFLRKLLIDRLALWGLQFDGHGALAASCPKCNTLNDPDAEKCRKCEKSLANAKRVGALAFESKGGVNWVPTDEFGSVLYNAKVRLAMLLACETARVGTQQVFSGLAPGLLLAGVPAVIGMQYVVLDDFANSFANEFYNALQRENDVLAALRVARRLNMQGAWYSPVLYLRHQPTDAEQEAIKPIYLSRNIDTATPSQVKAGDSFLVRLWIRRPDTKALTDKQLREELDIPEDVPVRKGEGEAEIKFEPVEGRKLRRGEVEARLTSPDCEVIPDKIKLFIDEHLDAPPAIFTVKAKKVGRVPLIFSVWQGGGQIHSVIHHVEAVEPEKLPKDTNLTVHSQPVEVEGEEDEEKKPVALPPLQQPAAAAAGRRLIMLPLIGAALVVIFVVALILLLSSGVIGPPPTPTPTPTLTATPTDTPAATDRPTVTPTATDRPTNTPTATDRPTDTPTATVTAVPPARPPITEVTEEPSTRTRIEEVWWCEYIDGFTWQWYTVEITYQDGKPIAEEAIAGPFTGPWQPNCPPRPVEEPSDDDGKEPSGGVPWGPPPEPTDHCKDSCGNEICEPECGENAGNCMDCAPY